MTNKVFLHHLFQKVSLQNPPAQNTLLNLPSYQASKYFMLSDTLAAWYWSGLVNGENGYKVSLLFEQNQDFDFFDISCFFYKFLWTFSVPRIFEKLKLPLREEALQVPIQIGRPIQLLCRKWNVEPRGKTLESPRRRLHGPGNPRVDGPQRWEAHWLSVSFQKFRKL